MIVCNAVNHHGPEESMRRLAAVEPLPVGERLARLSDDITPDLYWGWNRMLMRSIVLAAAADFHRVRAYARPLRHARERARRMESAKNGAYLERNKVVAAIGHMALALGHESVVVRHPTEDKTWEDDWRTILLINMPCGQLTWHFHDSERYLLLGIPEYEGPTWDGHSTEEKYARLHRVSGIRASALNRAQTDNDNLRAALDEALKGVPADALFTARWSPGFEGMITAWRERIRDIAEGKKP